MRLIEQFKAWVRKESMTKGVNRGRCFVKQSSLDSGGNTKVSAKAKVMIVSAKVIRADGTEEEIING